MSQTHSLDLEAGSSQYASIADASQTGLDITGDFTLEALIKLESSPGGNFYTIASKWAQDSNNRSYAFDYDGTNLRLLASSDGSSAGSATKAVALSNSIWYFVAFTYTASTGTAEFFVNNRSLGTATGTLPTSIFNGAADFRVGALRTTSVANFFDGLVKDVRLFSDKRTSAEMVSDAHTENVSDANLVGEWNFNNAYTDSSGNGNTLTSSGSPVFSTDIPWEGATQVSGSTYLETNLVSYWTLDEAGGNRADSHGSNTLADGNTTLSATGIISNAADFERSNNEYLTITDASQSGLDLTSDFSTSFWVNPESQPSNAPLGYFFSKWGGTTDSFYFSYRDDAGTKKVRFGDGTTSKDLTQTLSNATTYHLAMVYRASAGAVDIYVNAVQIGTMTGLATSLTNSNSNFTLAGLGSGPTDTFDGWMDEFAIYSRALHYGDVLDLYNGGVGITYVSSVAYTMDAAVGSFTLTGIAATFNKSLTMVASLGTFTLTGIAATLARGYSIVANTGTFALTGIAATFNKSLNMVASVGSFTLTGVAATFSKGINMVASTGSFILTGFKAIFPLIYTPRDKNTASYTPRDKNTASYSARTKNEATYTPRDRSNS